MLKESLEPSSSEMSVEHAEEEYVHDLDHDTEKGGYSNVTNIPELSPLERTISRLSTVSSITNPGPPPDGGLHAWFQCFLAHLTVVNIWGVVNSYGLFQTYYVNTLGHSPSDISWIGSFQIFLIFFIGTFSGRALDAGLFRITFAVGLALQIIGVFTTSVATEYWQIFLAQGICTGIGQGLQFCPTIGLVSTYFSSKKSTALALAAAGTATGGMIFPAMIQQLLPKIGFGWSLRTAGFLQLAIGLFCLAFLRSRLPPRVAGPLVEWPAFKEPTYVLYCLGMFFNFWGVYFGFYYISAFSRNFIDFNFAESIHLLILINGIGFLGRLVPGLIADRYLGPLNTLVPFTYICSILLFCWAAVDSRGGVYAFACIYGFFAAGVQSLWPAGLSSLTTDLKKAGVRIGMGFTLVSLACLTGPPLGGALLTADHGHYLYAQVWAASCLLLGGTILIMARYSKVGLKMVRV